MSQWTELKQLIIFQAQLSSSIVKMSDDKGFWLLSFNISGQVSASEGDKKMFLSW